MFTVVALGVGALSVVIHPNMAIVGSFVMVAVLFILVEDMVTEKVNEAVNTTDD